MATEKEGDKYMMEAPCPERLNSAKDFPMLQSQTYSEMMCELAVVMKALKDNRELQKEFVSVVRRPHRDLMALGRELHAVQQSLKSGSNESDSSFAKLLTLFSRHSVHNELQALITATESFRELLPTAVDCIISLSAEDISNLFILFKQIPMSSSAHTFTEPPLSEKDLIYCQLLSRIGFTNYRGHLMYEEQMGFCGLDMITITIAVVQSVTASDVTK